MIDIPTVPCETCGEPTTFTGMKRCNDCWGVERRLAGYLRRGGPKAESFVEAAMASPHETHRCPARSGRMRCTLFRWHLGNHFSMKDGAAWADAPDEKAIAGRRDTR